MVKMPSVPQPQTQDSPLPVDGGDVPGTPGSTWQVFPLTLPSTLGPASPGGPSLPLSNQDAADKGESPPETEFQPSPRNTVCGAESGLIGGWTGAAPHAVVMEGWGWVHTQAAVSWLSEPLLTDPGRRTQGWRARVAPFTSCPVGAVTTRRLADV